MPLNVATQSVGHRTGHAWEQLELPSYCRADMLLNLCNTAPLFKGRQLAVLHDASVMVHPTHYSWQFRTWYRVLWGGLMRHSSVIATVSKFSASELVRFFGSRGRGIEVIYESGEHILETAADAAILDRLGLRDERYILAVGSRSLNKNFDAVVRAAELLGGAGVRVVAAGGSNPRGFSSIGAASAKQIRTGYVSDGELRALYEHAECFVFPSFYEGFGLPPLEAMHCGCPVLVSRRAAIPEICGAAAAYCEPDDPKDIATQLQRILSSRALRDEMREAGLARARLFTWRQAAESLDEILTRH
jgi:glycosyltransferase involved in cell wall biosynthesis